MDGGSKSAVGLRLTLLVLDDSSSLSSSSDDDTYLSDATDLGRRGFKQFDCDFDFDLDLSGIGEARGEFVGVLDFDAETDDGELK